MEAGAGHAATDAALDAYEKAAAGDSFAEAVVSKPPDILGLNYEAMYQSLTTSCYKLVTELQSSLECSVCLGTIPTTPVKCCRY